MRVSAAARVAPGAGARSRLPPGRRGAVALEFAIVFPLVLVLTFGGVQVAFWFQARAMCQAAAQAGVRAGRVLGAPAGAGRGAPRLPGRDLAGDTVGAPVVNEPPRPPR